jgi:hypothetical protein
MFTVKHRDANGVETIHSAETIEVVPPNIYGVAQGSGEAGASNWDQAGIFLDRDQVPLIPTDQLSPRAAKHIILFGGDHTEAAEARKGGKVWVMNEAGATVATYEL